MSQKQTNKEKKGLVSRKTFDQVMVPVFSPYAFIPTKAKGLNVWDQNGKKYLDLTGGIAVLGLGHTPDNVVQALTKQAKKVWHVSNYFTNEPVLKLAKALTAATFAQKVFFCNSGGEANEAAFKLARIYAQTNFGAKKNKIVSCFHSFHGRTLFTVSVGGQAKYTQGFEPLPPGIVHIPFNDIEAAKATIDDDVCAVVVEPVQGEGGVLPATKEYLKALRELCNQKKALLIFDEVQCGLGRTGTLYAYMGYNVTPDILTSAKALGNGFPIAAMMTTNKIAQAFSVGSHGTTYGGNPLGAAVACEVVQTINKKSFLNHVVKVGDYLKGALQTLVEKYPKVFSQVRGKGLMLGLVMNSDYAGRAHDVTDAAQKEGLLLLVAGGDVIRFVPSLIVTKKQVNAAMKKLTKAIDSWLAQDAKK